MECKNCGYEYPSLSYCPRCELDRLRAEVFKRNKRSMNWKKTAKRFRTELEDYKREHYETIQDGGDTVKRLEKENAELRKALELACVQMLKPCNDRAGFEKMSPESFIKQAKDRS